MKLYFDVGLPEGHDTVIDENYIVLEPILVSLSISEGSAGGSLIKARVEGFGVGGLTNFNDMVKIAEKGVNLAQNSTGTIICEELSFSGYGYFECLTKPMDIEAASSIALY
jgi:hypothetical protein